MSSAVILVAVAIFAIVSLFLASALYRGPRGYILFIIYGVIFGGSVFAAWWFLTAGPRKAELLCQTVGGMQIAEQVQADGFVIESRYFNRYAELLLAERYQYLELLSDRDLSEFAKDYPAVKGQLTKDTVEYRRYYLSEPGDSNCIRRGNGVHNHYNNMAVEAFERLLDKYPSHRGRCVASKYTLQPLSRYHYYPYVRAVELPQLGVTPVKGNGYQEVDHLVIDRRSDKILGRYIGFLGESSLKTTRCLNPEHVSLYESVILMQPKPEGSRLWKEANPRLGMPENTPAPAPAQEEELYVIPKDLTVPNFY